MAYIRLVVMSIVVLINFILQSTLLNGIAVNGVIPNTALVIVVCYALLRGDVEGAILGFFVGLLADVFYGGWVGLLALFTALTGYLCGKPFKNLFRENFFLPVALVAISVPIYGIAFYCMTLLLQGRREFDLYFMRIILPETVYTTIITIPIYLIIHSINKRLEKYEKRFEGLFRKKR